MADRLMRSAGGMSVSVPGAWVDGCVEVGDEVGDGVGDEVGDEVRVDVSVDGRVGLGGEGVGWADQAKRSDSSVESAVELELDRVCVWVWMWVWMWVCVDGGVCACAL